MLLLDEVFGGVFPNITSRAVFTASFSVNLNPHTHVPLPGRFPPSPKGFRTGYPGVPGGVEPSGTYEYDGGLSGGVYPEPPYKILNRLLGGGDTLLEPGGSETSDGFEGVITDDANESNGDKLDVCDRKEDSLMDSMEDALLDILLRREEEGRVAEYPSDNPEVSKCEYAPLVMAEILLIPPC